MQMKTIRAAVERVQQRYAYHVVLAETAKAGFELVEDQAGRDGVIQTVNEAECDLLGYNAGEIVGRAAWDFVAPEERLIH